MWKKLDINIAVDRSIVSLRPPSRPGLLSPLKGGQW